MSDEKEKDQEVESTEAPEEAKEEKQESAPPEETSAPEPEIEDVVEEEVVDDDDRPWVLNRSVWYKPLTLIASSAITVTALIGMFFVPEEWGVFVRYAVGAISVAGLVWLLFYLFMTKVSATYSITPQRCTVERGLISRVINEVEIRHIRNINVRQTIMQRIFGIGDVEISTAGGSDIEVVFQSVQKPLEVRRRIVQFNDLYDNSIANSMED